MKRTTRIILSLLFVSSAAWAATETREFDAAELKTLKMKNHSGDIRIGASGAAKAVVTYEKLKFDEKCELDVKRFGDELQATVTRESFLGSWFGSWFGGDTCKVNFDVQIPAKVAVDIRSGSGNVELTGTTAAVEISVGSGDIAVASATGDLNIKTGSGDVQAKGLSGNAVVKTGSGDVTLTYATAPAKAEVDVKTGSGDATLYVPPTTKLISDFKAGSGRLVNEIGDSPTSEFRVSMRAGSGDLTIKKSE